MFFLAPCSLRSKAFLTFLRLSRNMEAIFAFWPHKNWMRTKRIYFFALAPVFARPKSEKCFKLAETLAPKNRALVVDKLNAI